MALKPTLGHLNESSPRAEAWRAVFGGLDVPVKSPIPRKVRMEAGDGLAGGDRYVYELDVAKLAPDVQARLVDHVAERFGIPRADVEAEIPTLGCPILCEDVSVSFDARLVM